MNLFYREFSFDLCLLNYFFKKKKKKLKQKLILGALELLFFLEGGGKFQYVIPGAISDKPCEYYRFFFFFFSFNCLYLFKAVFELLATPDTLFLAAFFHSLMINRY